MRWSKYFWYTLKEEPADAEAVSHKLLLKGGFLAQVASGIYEYTPPALKVLRKIENIVRKEMDRSGAQEVLLSVLNPSSFGRKLAGGICMAGNFLNCRTDTEGNTASDLPTRRRSQTSLGGS